MLARSLMMVPAPMVRGAKVEVRRERSWIMVLGPRVIGWVPERAARGWTSVVGCVFVGGGAGLEADGRDVGAGRAVMVEVTYIGGLRRACLVLHHDVGDGAGSYLHICMLYVRTTVGQIDALLLLQSRRTWVRCLSNKEVNVRM